MGLEKLLNRLGKATVCLGIVSWGILVGFVPSGCSSRSEAQTPRLPPLVFTPTLPDQVGGPGPMLKDSGYVAWIQAESGLVHRIKLNSSDTLTFLNFLQGNFRAVVGDCARIVYHIAPDTALHLLDSAQVWSVRDQSEAALKCRDGTHSK